MLLLQSDDKILKKQDRNLRKGWYNEAEKSGHRIDEQRSGRAV